MAFQYPKTVAACLKQDKSQWEIGDALCNETCEPDEKGFGDEVEQVRKELETQEIYYTKNTLVALRRTAKAFKRRDFKRKTRKGPISLAFAIYEAAGDEETLSRAIERAQRNGKDLTQAYMNELNAIFHQEDQADKARQRQEAEDEAEAAAKEEARAAEAERNATDAAEKAAKKREKEAAAKKKKEAKDKAKSIKTAPNRKKGGRQKPKTMMVGKMSVLVVAHKSTKFGEKATAAMEPHLDDLSDKAIAALAEAGLEAMNAWQAFCNMIRSRTHNKRGHLRAVNE